MLFELGVLTSLACDNWKACSTPTGQYYTVPLKYAGVPQTPPVPLGL